MPASYLKIGGVLVQDAVLLLVEVEQRLNSHWWCRIECRRTMDQRFSIENALGQDLQILTYDQGGTQHIIFDGFVLAGQLEYEIYGSYTARITGVTRSYKLDLTEREAYFRKKTLSDVANALAGMDGVSAAVNAPAKPPKNYVQWGETDFAFLHRLADDHQAWMRPSAQGIEIWNSFQSGTQVAWRTEDGLLSFEVTGRIVPPSFSGTHYDARNMTSTDFQAVQKAPDFSGASSRMVGAVQRASAGLPSGYIHLDPRAATSSEYQDLLERESIRTVGAGVFAVGRSLNEAIQAGNTVEVSGPMDAQGTYGVTEVLHRWTQKGYHNEFRCTPWNNYVNPQRPDPKVMRGVVTARVVEHNDPRKMGRVKVQYDWQEDGETGWIRMTTPHAGADRGFMFMPEKGDEVLVAFEHGDSERPYVIGALWNGVDQAPREDFWDSDIANNDVKRIVTKSGHRIQLSDTEGKEGIVIATPSKLKIALLEKADETGRSMILLHSEDGDIFVNAPNGRVHLRSKYLSREVGGASSAAPPPQKQAATPAPGGSPSPAPSPSHSASMFTDGARVDSAGTDVETSGSSMFPTAPANERQAEGAAVFPGQQSYNNCGIQSAAQIIERVTGHRPDEKELMDKEVAEGNASQPNPVKRIFMDQQDIDDQSGGTTAGDRQNILKDYKIPSEVESNTKENLAKAIKEKKGVIASVDAGVFWEKAGNMSDEDAVQYVGDRHAVMVYDGDFDADGNLTDVYINDTGSNQQGIKMSADDFMAASNGDLDDKLGGDMTWAQRTGHNVRGSAKQLVGQGSKLNVTDDPIW